MTDISRLCMVCLSETDENGVCPDCGGNTGLIQDSPLLPLKTVLAQRYVIASMQKKNSEGITYSAYDIKLGKSISVREFFPEGLAERDSDGLTVREKKTAGSAYSKYLGQFSDLWSKLMRLKGLSALITVTDVFKANSTVYAVYDESERITLRDYLLSTKEGYIPWEKARLLFMPVLSTLGTLHTSQVLHRGLNPSSFIFSANGKLKITDFCIEAARSDFGAIDGELFDGYTPIEQYTGNEPTGAWSDIYSFCSVLYRTLIGSTPIDAKTRILNDQMMIPAKFAEQLPPYVINALINGMEIKASDRTDNVEQLRCDLSASPRAMGASANAFAEKQQSAAQPKPVQQQVTEAPKAAVKSSDQTENPARSDTPAPTSATKKINPFIMPLSPMDEPKKVNTKSTVEKSQTQTLYVPQQLNRPNVPNSPHSTDSDTAAAEQSPELLLYEEERREKKKKLLIAAGCAFLLCIITGIILIYSSLIGKPLVGGVRVPDFTGMDISEINENSTYSANFEIETVVQYSIEQPMNHIISQSLEKDSRVPKNSRLVLTVSLGPKTMVMPDLTGATPEEAQRLLTDMGLICEITKYFTLDTSKHGNLHGTIPEQGQYIGQGEKVLIQVFAPPETEELPDVSDNGSGNSVSEFLDENNYR